MVSRATLSGLALVDRGSYPQSIAEIRKRSGRVLRSKLPYDRALSLRVHREVRIGQRRRVRAFGAFQQDGRRFDGQNDQRSDRGRARYLGSRRQFPAPARVRFAGTLRATSTDAGLDIEVDLPAGTVGDEIVAAHESAGVVVRPLIDMNLSEFVDTARGREYTKPHLRAFIVGATDTKSGWDDAVIEEVLEGPPVTTKDKVAALSKLSKRRRRTWY